MMLLLFLCLVTACSSLHDDHLLVSSFSGYQVHRCHLESHHQLELLAQLRQQEEYELWTEPSLVRPVDIMTVPGTAQGLLSLLEENNIPCQTYIEDVESLIQEERESMGVRGASSSSEGFNLTTYHDYYEIMAHLDDVAALYDFVETEVIGQSWEGRDLKIIKICKDGCGNKPAIWIDGGIHAREWISPATALWTLDVVLKDHNMIDNLDWFIHPVVNPDGFTFTHEHVIYVVLV